MSRLDRVLDNRVHQLNKATGDNYQVESAYNRGWQLIRNLSSGGATDVHARRITRQAMIEVIDAILYVQHREYEKYVRERVVTGEEDKKRFIDEKVMFISV